MQQQVVSVEDRITLEEMQTSLTSVLLVRNPFPYGLVFSWPRILGAIYFYETRF